MSLEDFYNNVRLGQRLLESSQGTSGSLDLDIWLTPRIVAGYDPRDFDFLDEDDRRELEQAVQSFQRIAEVVPPTHPATSQQRDEARHHLLTILQILDPDRYRSPQELIAARALDGFRKSQAASNYVTDLRYRFDNDEGELTILVWLLLREDISLSRETFTKAEEIRTLINKWLTYYGVDAVLVTNLLSASDQRKWEALSVS